jgi:hypothetical protein
MDLSPVGQEDEEIKFGSMDWISPQAFRSNEEVREILNCARDFIYNSNLDLESRSKESETVPTSSHKHNPSQARKMTFGSNRLMEEALDLKRTGTFGTFGSNNLTTKTIDLKGMDLGKCMMLIGSSLNGFKLQLTPNSKSNHPVRPPLIRHSSQ